MKTNESFQTLTRFQEVLEKCVVTTSDGKTVSLAEGLQRAVGQVMDTDRKKLSVILVGNGGSAAIASHQAVDLWKNGGIRATAFNDASLLTCIANDYGYEHVFAKPIEMFAKSGDLLIAVSSSGKSENILKAVEAAKKTGCRVITLSGFAEKNPLSLTGDLNFFLPSDSYGIVEVGHLLLIHSIVDECIRAKRLAAPQRVSQNDELHH